MSNSVRVTGFAVVVAFGIGGCSGGSSSNSDTEPAPDLQGSIAIEAQTRVDSDTADDARLGLASNNDSPSFAQSLPSNVTVGGYLSANQGVYNSGFAYNTDTQDYFAVDLVAGDRVTFQVFGSPADLLNVHTDPPTRSVRILQVRGGNLDPVFEESLTGNFDPITHTLPEGFESGAYLLEVSASAGMPFRYVLSVADVANTASTNAQYAVPPFVTQQAVVELQPTAQAASSMRAMNVVAGKSLGGNFWLMQRATPSVVTMSTRAHVDEVRETLSWVSELANRADVKVAEPNYLFFSQASAPDNDPLYARQWNLPLMQLPEAWQIASAAGDGVGIAVMDTGLFTSNPSTAANWHPDINLNVPPLPSLPAGEFWDWVAGDLDIDNDPGRDFNPADPGDGKAASSNFHGTHVAGIAAAVDNDQGIVGVASSATLYPVRVLGREGVGSSADLIDAINWAAGRSDIDVINLSLGGLGPSLALENAINLAYDNGNGQLIVAAAGNQNTDQATYPAAYENVVGVGAVDGASVRAGYSNVGPSVDLVAPGGDASRDANQDGFADVIISAWGTDDGGVFSPGYAGLQGTSMAAPHVAGVYALMKAEVPGLLPRDFWAFLRGGELTQPIEPVRDYGLGLIDAVASMDAALNGEIPVTLSASPSALQLNSAVLSGQLELTSFPEGESVTVTSATSVAGWLSADFGPTGSTTSATVTVTADPSGLDADGRYLADLSIAYSPDGGGPPDELIVPVSLQLGSAGDAKDAGRHYVLLVSTAEIRETVDQRFVSAVDGRYRFTFETVEPDEYFLVAGTDTDNNGLICENGEACAEYPVNGLPETLNLGDTPRTGVSLSTSFRRPTVSSLGLPRAGFEGYRVLPTSKESSGSAGQKEYRR